MIIWSGLGFLVAAIVVISVVLTIVIFQEFFPTHQNDIMQMIIALLFSAVSIYFIGIRLNSSTKSKHTFFFIPMQYWGIIIFVFTGVVILDGLLGA